LIQVQHKKSDWHVGPPPTTLTLKLKQTNKVNNQNVTIFSNRA